ncbi:MAG TPA: 50S ribosomal protein L13 [Elusimicrobia bacterium]|nr:MAG: 50S ribosomal protein L13 [Elusimicrobia bacterium GWD2_63_28]HCC48154.1 50S ribosomal protein L13 [Elusimicrobiota bacterium]
MIQKTTLPKAATAEKTRKWHFLDASDQVLGRLSTKIAVLLMGKHKRDYAPNVDCGDFVVVTNTDKVRITGNKLEDKFYFRHSGYANGAKTIPYKRQMENDSTRVLELAVKRMLDDNKMRDRRLKRLRIFSGAQTQFPVPKPAAK